MTLVICSVVFLAIVTIAWTSAFQLNCKYQQQQRPQYKYEDEQNQWQWRWQRQPYQRQLSYQRRQQLYCCTKEEQRENKEKNEASSMLNNDNDDNHNNGGVYNNDNNRITQSSRSRRKVIQTLGLATAAIATGILGAPSIGHAGEVGTGITKAITTSDIGISVRTSVVRGAQYMDKIDGQWEKFSDTYGLGSERHKTIQEQQRRRQQQRVMIPDSLPLNIDAAQQILDISDEVFLEIISSISREKLNTRIEQIIKSTKSSFERSGVTFLTYNSDENENGNRNDLNLDYLLRFQTASQFNFVLYAHFKAYSDLIIQLENNNNNTNNIKNFSKFQTEYERNVGQRLIETWKLGIVDNNNSSRSSILSSTLSSSSSSSSSANQRQKNNGILKNRLFTALEQTDLLGKRLRDLGLVSIINRRNMNNNIEITTTTENDDIQDFVDDALTDLVITVAINGDVTLQSQIILQEQGYRLYPNFTRFIVTEFFREATTIETQQQNKVSVIDYYFDTNFNSDPNKFEVKEVLLSISIE